MKLPEVLAALEAEIPTHSSWRVAVLTRKTRDAATDDGRIIEFSVFEVSADDADKEINLLTDEDAEGSRPAANGMNVGQLLSALSKLRERCSAYSVYSGSSYVPVDNKYELRYDSPLVGVARNPEAEVFGFLQWPPEQWETTE